MVWRSGVTRDCSLVVKACSADAAVASGILASKTARLMRSTSTLVARPLDEIALPVAGHQAVLDLGRAHMDADHLGESRVHAAHSNEGIQTTVRAHVRSQH